MATRILLRRDTAANWTNTNPVLASGEEGFETDTLKRKVGNGTDVWADLVYLAGGIVMLDEDDMVSNADNKVPSQQSVVAYVGTKTALLDEDNMASNSATQAATQKSVKKYVDDNAGGQLLDEDDFASNDDTKGATQQSIKVYVDSRAPVLLDEDDFASDDATKPASQQSTKAYITSQLPTVPDVATNADVETGTDNVKIVTAAGLKNMVLDEDDMASNSDVKLASQQSIKVYVDGRTTLLDEDDMSSDSATQAPTQQSVKQYVADAVSGGMAYKGGYDADTNTPNLDDSPAAGSISLGDTYTVTVDGTFYATNVTVGNTLMSEKDDPTAEGDWTIVNRANISATSVSNDASGNLTSTVVQDSLVELQGDIDTINADNATATSIDGKIKTQVTDNLVDDITSGGTTKYLSAEQGKLLGTNKMDASALVDEDDMASDSAVKVPTQQSVKAYVDANTGGGLELLDEDDMVTDDATKVPSQQSVKAYVSTEVSGIKAVTELYTATAGQTEFNIANTVAEKLTVMQEGFVVDPADYDRDATKITLHTGADVNEQVYIVAYNG